MTKTLDQLAASTTTADADLLLKRDSASGDDKKIREDDLQLARSAVRQINVGGAADYTLTNGDAGRALIELIGALTDNIDVIVPTSGRRYTFVNSTSGSFTVTVKTSAGTGVLLPQGELRQVRCDGTNVITGDGFSDFTSMPEVNGVPIVEQASSQIGWGQSWQDVTASRTNGVTYTNSTGKPISVDISFSGNTGGAVQLEVDGTPVSQSGVASSWLRVSAIVPDGSTYELANFTGTLRRWMELR